MESSIVAVEVVVLTDLSNGDGAKVIRKMFVGGGGCP